MVSKDRFALLVDFGSTYTKVRAFNLTQRTLAGSAQGPSTVTTDLTLGLTQALGKLAANMGRALPEFTYRLASSSAAGGLRMVTIGLVSELTAEAARLAALGAGAKVVGVFSYGLCAQDIDRVQALRPDVILLAGGTDGGNAAVITGNAELLAASSITAPVVVAGNRNATASVCATLQNAGKRAIVAANVMPAFGVIEIESAQSKIRDVFLDQIVHAKGLDKAVALLDGVTMPTPVAVLKAAQLLAQGTNGEDGMGDLVIVDPGGATTDVHSACAGLPSNPRIIRKGLPEPYLKRTVEGDLGLRHNARSILETQGIEGLARIAGLPSARVEELVAALEGNVESLPGNSEEDALDFALGRVAVDIAMDRHAGRVEVAYGNEGPVTFQYGKDLSKLQTLIGTGGILAHGRMAEATLKAALASGEAEASLRPRAPHLYLDKDYILFACGLLAEHDRVAAYEIARRHLHRVDGAQDRRVEARAQALP